MAILIVDDSPDQHLLLRSLLANAGHNDVLTADSAQAAFDQLNLARPEPRKDIVKQMILPVGLIPTLAAGIVCATGRMHAATYVVDQAAPAPADANPGAEQSPFKTVQRPVNEAKAGATVLVMAGKYDERVRVRTSCTEGQPITLRAVPRRSAILNGIDLQASYIRIEGFEITAEKPATAVQLGGNHCEVLDNYIHHMMVGVAGTVGKPSPDGKTRDYAAVAHNRIAYNKVYHSQYGLILGGEDWLVENNDRDSSA